MFFLGRRIAWGAESTGGKPPECRDWCTVLQDLQLTGQHIFSHTLIRLSHDWQVKGIAPGRGSSSGRSSSIHSCHLLEEPMRSSGRLEYSSMACNIRFIHDKYDKAETRSSVAAQSPMQLKSHCRVADKPNVELCSMPFYTSIYMRLHHPLEEPVRSCGRLEVLSVACHIRFVHEKYDKKICEKSSAAAQKPMQLNSIVACRRLIQDVYRSTGSWALLHTLWDLTCKFGLYKVSQWC